MIFLTNFPSFYKINLYNKLYKEKKFKVIFLGKTSKFRDKHFSKFSFSFPSRFVFNKHYEDRNKILSILNILYLLYNSKSNKVILTGWNEVEYWLALFFIFKKKILILETNLNYTKKNVFKILLKKIFLFFINKVVVCGKSQIQLLKYLNFKKKILISNGVGLINRNYKLKKNWIARYKKNFLYIGRLEQEEKNVLWLVNFFKKNTEYKLNLVGKGSLKSKITKQIKNSYNISIYKNVANNKLKTHYLNNSFLILPSTREAWGLVVEEAFHYGKPVIVSKYCGAAQLVKDKINGYVFNPTNDSLRKILKKITNKNYRKMSRELVKEPINNDNQQVKAYLNL